ncbi:MAG TPA: hypothetical protein EYH16_04550 [Leucothrix mucor]|nr:hypothetical protein [Leucothrix mucor]
MKGLYLLIMTLLTASVLTACGGGESSDSKANADSSSNSDSSGNSDSSEQGELIIDSGRGTVNGKDTEMPER